MRKEFNELLLKMQGLASKGADSLTDDEALELKNGHARLQELKAQMDRAKESEQVADALKGFTPEDEGKRQEQQKGEKDTRAKSLGEHFVKNAGETLKLIKGVAGASATAPEFKAATDTVATGGPTGSIGVLLTDVDRTVVQGYRVRPTIADLISTGSISGQAITYFLEGALEGDFSTVGEGTQKPQLSHTLPTPVTDSLKEIAGWIRYTDDMMEDLAFLVSEVNNRLVYRLSMVEENQILNGPGTGTSLLGILNRSGVQTHDQAADTVADAIFKAMGKVQTATGLSADGLAINPVDYQNLRLTKDANEQYLGGGFFQGQYGNGTFIEQPPVWGLRTIVTTAVTAGSPVVAAWNQGATLYRKGGVRVESTNSHADDFTNDRVTVRIRERVALAVRVPSAFVKVTLGAGV